MAAYDALATDVHALKAIAWEAIVLDERQHGRAQLNKVRAGCDACLLPYIPPHPTHSGAQCVTHGCRGL